MIKHQTHEYKTYREIKLFTYIAQMTEHTSKQVYIKNMCMHWININTLRNMALYHTRL